MKRVVVSAATADRADDHALICDVVESCRPKDTKYVIFSFEYDDDNLELCATGHNIYDVDEEYSVDEYAIDKLEIWARAIAKKLNEKGELSQLADNLISKCNWDWYSGMTLFGGGNTPFTYNGFTLSAEAYES